MVVFIILCAVALGVLAFSFFVCGAIMQDAAIRRYPRLPAFSTGESKPVRGKMRQEGMAYLQERPHETWRLKTADGLWLQAGFWPADALTGRTVLAVHGYRCTGEKEFGMFAAFYHQHGFNVLLPDNRAHGKSEGEYIGFGWLDQGDCLAWAALAQQRIPECRLLLHGISMGASTVLMAAGQEHCPAAVRGVVADCGYASGWKQMAWQLKCVAHLPPFPTLYGASWYNRLLAGYSFRQADTAAWARRIRVPVQLVHGDADTYVPAAMAQELYDALACEKYLWMAPGATHTASWVACNAQYRQVLQEFLNRLDWGEKGHAIS